MFHRNFRALSIALLIAVCSAGRLSAQSGSSADAAVDAANDNGAEVLKTSKPEKRVLGVIPNYRTVDASLPFTKLSPRQKLSIATHDSFDWPTFVVAGFLTFLTPDDSHSAFGSGIEGYANRYVRSSADQIIGNMMTEGFMPVILKADPRYFRQGTGTTWFRLRTALIQTAVARRDSGRLNFNAPEFLGNAIAVGISNAYSPNLQTWSRRSEKFALMISMDTISNVLKEFGPDLKDRFLSHRHKT